MEKDHENPDKILSIQVNQEIIVSVGKRNFGRFNTWDYIHDLKVLDLYKREETNKEKIMRGIIRR